MMNSVKINYIALAATLIVVLILMTGVYYRSHSPPETPEFVNLKELLSVSIELVERGGAKTVEVKKHHKLNAESKGKTKEGAKEMKTDGDMQSHRAIVAGFHKSFPYLTSRIVSEEHDTTPDDKDATAANKVRPEVKSLPDELVNVKDLTIWIDPLDATQEYTEDLDHYVTVMVCIAVKGKPVVGVIHRTQNSEDYKKETVWAWVGRGISSNMGAKKDLSQVPAKPTVIISRSHGGNGNDLVNKAFGGGTVIPAGGAGFKVLEVVRGKADVYAHVTLIKKWDICAGNALLDAVGGQMKTLKNETINYDKSSGAPNEHGLLASMANFNYYLGKLGPVFAAEKS